MSNFIRTYGGNTDTMKNSGLMAINKALAAGLTINQIRNQAAREGITFGSKGQEFLDARPADSFISKYGGNEDTMKNSGMSAVNLALADGLTPEQISTQADAAGISFGYRAANYLNNAAEQKTRLNTLENSLNSALNANKTLASRYSNLETSMNRQLQSLNTQLTNAQNSYNTPRNVATSTSLGGFSPSSMGTPMSIRQQGTSRFNRDKRTNALRISNINI